MDKRGIFELVMVIFSVVVIAEFTGIGIVSAVQNITVVTVNESYKAVYITDAVNVYSYEVNFNITRDMNYTIYQGYFFGSDNVIYGTALDDGGAVLSVYGSKLDGIGQGTSGSGNLFNISFDSPIRVYTALFIGNNESEYNVPICGNGVIESGETCSNCEDDVGECPPVYCGDGSCNGDETCSSCELDCGACGVTGGGGGGGSITLNLSDVQISTDPGGLTVRATLGESLTRYITVKNNGDKPVKLDFSTMGLNPQSKANSDSLSLVAGQSEKINLTLSAVKKGIIAGALLIKSGGVTVKEVPIIIDVATKDFLFDISINVLNKNKMLIPGERLEARVKLTEMLKKLNKVNVTVIYLIKDFNGRTYLDEQEHFIINNEFDIVKEFDPVNLPEGKYILGLEVSYPNEFATSSDQFSVVKERPSSIMIWLLTLVAIFLFVGIVVIIHIIKNKGGAYIRMRGSKRK